MKARHTSPVLLVVAVCLVAANMRPAITAIGPVLDDIGADIGVPTAVLGLISSLVLITWLIVSPFAHDLSRRFGLSRTMLAALGLLVIGVVVRSIPGASAWLWIGTIVIGVAIGIGNVLMPAAIKRDFPSRVPVMMGVYSALLGAFGALASGAVVPLAELPFAGGTAGWRFALLITGGVLLPFAIVAWAAATRHEPRPAALPRGHRHPPTGIWRDPVAWLVAGYMGLQSATFYILVTWLAAISTSGGRDAVTAGFDVMFYQLVSIVGSLTVPFALRGRLKRLVPALIPLLGAAGTVGLMVAPDAILVWCAVLGLFSGASLGMALTLMAERARDHDAATALSGMSQSFGYGVAALGPVAFGALYAATGGWGTPLALLLVIMLGLSAIGVFAGRESFVLERR
ncbi:MFS transporter [Microbacterium fluvii]|uniref:MFS transporter n=1 Tax=Microbacterium fluvii TaxID=415215 RepID=A0ABW2HF99_9MICO|nr:MFS transporter [Microbacterium fluvii]MCU4673284.1 MFS transporter [Microbacterium fluvii]